MNATELAARLRQDSDPVVARWISWAEGRGRGEELRLLQPFVDAGLVEVSGDDYRPTLEGRMAVRGMLRGTPTKLEVTA